MSWNTHIPKFRRFVLQNFPFIEEDFDALTDYELICKVVEFLNKVITSQNELITEVGSFETDITNDFNRLEGLFNDLKSFVDNYFDNLDVQEEINIKLDAMAEDGSLQEIITSYIQSNVAWTFDNVAEMKIASNLINDSYAQTFGFYNIGDGGGSKYKIRTITDQDVVDEETIFALNDQTLVAELLPEDEMNILQFGIVGDGTTDLSTKLNKALSYRKNEHIKLNFNPSETYLAQNNVYLYSNTELNLNGATIKSCHDGDDTDYIEFGNGLRFLNNETSTVTAGYGAIENIEIYNGTFDGYQSGIGFFILHGLNIKFHDLTLKDCCVGTHVFDLGGCKDVEFKNCIFDGYLISNDNNKYREMIQMDYAESTGMPYWEGAPTYDGLPTVFVSVDNCKFYKGGGTYYPSAVGSHSRSNDYFIERINIRNCYFDGTSYSSIRFVCARNISVENNYFFVNAGVGIRLQSYILSKPINNVKILNNRFVLANNYSTAIQMTGNKEDSSVYYGEKINIAGNTCTGDYDASNITYDTYFITLGDIKNIIVADNDINNCKFFILKNNNSYFKESSISDNRINYCGNYITATESDGITYTEGSTALSESNNIWTDNNVSFNINNFKLMLTATSDLTADQSNQSYYLVPVDTRNFNIGEFLTDQNINYRLPKCIRKFKVTAHINAKCGSNTNYKIFRININDGTNNYMNGSRKTFVANEEDNVSICCVVDKGHIMKTNDQYRLGVQCYLENSDKILAKFGVASLSYILIEGC